MPKVPLINNRKELRSVFISVIDKIRDQEELDLNKKLKTYVIESNIPEVNSGSIKGNFHIQNTSDNSLKILNIELSEKNKFSFYLDVYDKRFWKLHSLYDSSTTKHIIKKLVECNSSKLDYLWLPSNLLEKYMEFGNKNGFGVKFKNKFINKENKEEIKTVSMRFWGGGAEEVIDHLRRSQRLVKGISLSSIGIDYLIEGGFSKENIANFGRFTMMKGNSIDSHFNIVDKIKFDYSKILSLLESKYRLTFEERVNGFKLSGSPLYIDFDKPIENVRDLTDTLVSSKNPFRLSGVKQFENESFFRVFGIDLHTNHLINLEITPNWIAIYLNYNSCGNVVTRLVTNIQTYLTSEIKLVGEDNERII